MCTWWKSGSMADRDRTGNFIFVISSFVSPILFNLWKPTRALQAPGCSFIRINWIPSSELGESRYGLPVVSLTPRISRSVLNFTHVWTNVRINRLPRLPTKHRYCSILSRNMLSRIFRSLYAVISASS